jgi:hypothetical protein
MPKERIILDMACSCGEEGNKAMEQLMTEFTQRISIRDEDLDIGGYSLEPSWITSYIHALTIDFDGYISSIASDMWCGVEVTVGYRNDQTAIYCECDLVEHGLATIYMYLADNKAKSLEKKNDNTGSDYLGETAGVEA